MLGEFFLLPFLIVCAENYLLGYKQNSGQSIKYFYFKQIFFMSSFMVLMCVYPILQKFLLYT